MRMVIVAAVLALLAGTARAQPATADAEVKLAEAAAAKGDFVAAANHYKLAYAAEARPEQICNAGVAYYKAKDITRAHLYLSRCQERGTALDADFVSAVRAALAAVETALRAGAFTPVDIVARPEGATVIVQSLGDSDAFVGSRLLWLPRGNHTLTVRAEGYAQKIVEVDAQGSERLPVTVTLDKETVAPPITPDVEPEPRPRPLDPLPPAPETPRERPSKIPGIVAIGATLAAFVVSGIAYTRAHNAADRARDALSMDAYDDDKGTANTWNTVMGVSGAAGVVGIGASAFLVFRW